MDTPMDSYRRRWLKDVVETQDMLRKDDQASDDVLTALMKHCWPTKTNQNT